MSVVEVLGVKVAGPQATFVDQFTFEITFEAHRDLPQDLEWKIVYVGSANSSKFDQTLETVLVGPVKPGKNRFALRAPPPKVNNIPKKRGLGSNNCAAYMFIRRTRIYSYWLLCVKYRSRNATSK